MKTFGILCLLFGFFSCTSQVNEKESLKLILDEHFNKRIAIAHVIVVSSYDCVECINSLDNVLPKLKNSLVLGIFYKDKNNIRAEFKSMLDNTKDNINWTYSNDINLLKSISIISGLTNGPYLITVENGQVIRIGSLGL